MTELITSLKKAGLGEDSAVRFAAIHFTEMTRIEPDDD